MITDSIFYTLRRAVAQIIFPEIIEMRNQAERLANTDPLTGLANRRAFDLAQPAAEADPNTSIILFDANNFGKVNKLVGHSAGDAMLCEIADALRMIGERYGIATRVFRFGGDEFALIAPASQAQRIRTEAENAFGTRNVAPDVFVSISGTVAPTFQAADCRLQTRKQFAKALQAASVLS